MSASDPSESKGRGRPSEYSQDAADCICAEISIGRSLREICDSPGMPAKSTVLRWLANNLAFQAGYAAAKKFGAMAILEEIQDIADDGRKDWIQRPALRGADPKWEVNMDHIQRCRLMIVTRQWHLSKLVPKKYGDRVEISAGNIDLSETIQAKRLVRVEFINRPPGLSGEAIV